MVDEFLDFMAGCVKVAIVIGYFVSIGFVIFLIFLLIAPETYRYSIISSDIVAIAAFIGLTLVFSMYCVIFSMHSELKRIRLSVEETAEAISEINARSKQRSDGTPENRLFGER